VLPGCLSVGWVSEAKESPGLLVLSVAGCGETVELAAYKHESKVSGGILLDDLLSQVKW